MNLSKIHHIAIIVSDYEAAKNFYVNTLGFSVIRENYRPERKDWKLDLRVNEYTELPLRSTEKRRTTKHPYYQPLIPLTFPKPPLPRICLIRKVYTSQVLLIKKKLVLEQSGNGDTEQ